MYSFPCRLAAPASTSFMLPRWGGLVIGNSLETVNSPTDERISSVMGVVVAQIRTLLGLPLPAWSVDGVDIDVSNISTAYRNHLQRCHA